MKTVSILTAAMASLAIATPATPAAAQYFHGGDGHPALHTSTRWKECSIQLDPSLTKAAWNQFTREAAMVVYFRPLTDARPMGKGNFEVSLLQWKTGIDDTESAWNDTFVHPDAEHILFEGSGLAFPGLTARVGVTETTDVGAYVTKNPNANYGVWAVQMQQSLVRGDAGNLAVRGTYSALYGPEDVDLGVIGADIVASKSMRIARWTTLSPYAGVSTYLTRSHEKSAVVNLADESTFGMQAMAGASLEIGGAKLAMEYNVADVNSLSFKIGFGK